MFRKAALASPALLSPLLSSPTVSCNALSNRPALPCPPLPLPVGLARGDVHLKDTGMCLVTICTIDPRSACAVGGAQG